MRLFNSVFTDESGQDLVEYSLLLGFLCLASAALFMGAGGNVNAIWTIANNQLSTAAVSAGS